MTPSKLGHNWPSKSLYLNGVLDKNWATLKRPGEPQMSHDQGRHVCCNQIASGKLILSSYLGHNWPRKSPDMNGALDKNGAFLKWPGEPQMCQKWHTLIKKRP